MDPISRAIKWRATPTVFFAWVAACLLIPAADTFGSDFTMKGPSEEVRVAERADGMETSSVRVAFLGMIRLYQSFVSPVGGVDRCGFRPSCSRYGYQAIQEQGPLVGIMMIGDRQTRCNIFKEPGADYTLLPNGKLYDPVSNNLLFEK
ncbi:MAG TPA: membrane protein insertion efficiency factor YidD [Syntrophales bacterium]|nr:membrane protein insertion efficiency factor YidD [Syntrophales bacterium]